MVYVAADAVGAAWLDGSRAAMAGFLVGLLATFLFVRVNTRLIRAQVSWWFHDIESEGGTHVHHMVIGVVLMVTVGVLFIALAPSEASPPRSSRSLFGVGVALTLDEFALILNLQDVYWRKEGRLSVDAVIIVVTAASLFVVGVDPFADLEQPGPQRRPLPRRRRRLHRGRHRPGAALPAQGQDLDRGDRASSCRSSRSWARSVSRASTRRGRGGATGRGRKSWSRPSGARHACARTRLAWRDAFFDLIAGKPHLPSLPPGGASGGAAGCGRAGGRRGRRRPFLGAGGRDDREVVDEPALHGHDGLPRRFQREPGGAVDLRELRRVPERGGHSMVNVLLVMAPASQSCSTAQAKMSLWPCALTPPRGWKGPSGSSPVSSRVSRRATASRSAPAARLRALAAVAVAGSGPSSSGSARPLGMLQAPASFLAQYGPPGCTSSTSTRRRRSPGPRPGGRGAVLR